MANLIRRCKWCNPNHIMEEINRPDLTQDEITDGMCDQAKAAWDQQLAALKAAKAAGGNAGQGKV